ncbi:MAG: radical SAM family heme chaperone HemW [Coriobacteriia bacterium]|nr:radical SAM family heme chaperone HemW [Coriobacteriia bacterium]
MGVASEFKNPETFEPYQALYIHIPFCKARCHYCDFPTEAIDTDSPLIDAYIESLVLEIRAAARGGLLGQIKSIYLGGGTPSHIGARRLVNLIYTLSVSMNLHSGIEFTLECNPESLTSSLVRDVFALGVNRFSLGVQSFIDSELVTMGRVHDSQKAHEAIDTVLERCSNVSIDLICGIPGQDMVSWAKTLDAALSHDITHISIYPLTIEDTTPLAQAIKSGLLAQPDEDLQAEMMLFAQDRLAQAGVVRYEVASYARIQEDMQEDKKENCPCSAPDYNCRHNIAYWTGLPYLGLGHHAAGMRIHSSTLARERLLEGKVIERLSPQQAALEDIMLGMRLVQGIPHAHLETLALNYPKLSYHLQRTLCELAELELVDKTATHYMPTNKGWLLGNEIFGRIWALEEHCDDSVTIVSGE